MVDIEKLRSFYYVIKEGSLLKAAALLEKNYTTLSKHLTELEETYKVKLFVRNRKRIELTDKGNELFKLVQGTIPSLENGASEILSPKPHANTLRIITTAGHIGIWVVKQIKELMMEFPDLRIAIMTTNADVDFETSKADVGILTKQSSKGLSQRYIRTIHFQLFASQEYIRKYGAPQTIEELKNHRLISFYSDYEGNVGNVDWHLKRGLPDHALRQSHLSINSGFLTFEAGCQGLGIISIMTEFEHIPTSNLVNIPLDEPGPSIDIFYITRNDVVPTKVQRRLLEILLEQK